MGPIKLPNTSCWQSHSQGFHSSWKRPSKLCYSESSYFCRAPGTEFLSLKEDAQPQRHTRPCSTGGAAQGWGGIGSGLSEGVWWAGQPGWHTLQAPTSPHWHEANSGASKDPQTYSYIHTCDGPWIAVKQQPGAGVAEHKVMFRYLRYLCIHGHVVHKS